MNEFGDEQSSIIAVWTATFTEVRRMHVNIDETNFAPPGFLG